MQLFQIVSFQVATMVGFCSLAILAHSSGLKAEDLGHSRRERGSC